MNKLDKKINDFIWKYMNPSAEQCANFFAVLALIAGLIGGLSVFFF